MFALRGTTPAPLIALLAGAVLFLGTATAGAGDSPPDVREKFLERLRTRKAARREEAFSLLNGQRGVPGVRLAIEGVKLVLVDRKKMLRAIPTHVARYEAARAEDNERKDEFRDAVERGLSGSRVRSLESAAARAAERRSSTWQELTKHRKIFRSTRTLLDRAGVATSWILRRCEGDVLREALDEVHRAWAGRGDVLTWPIWVDALARSGRPASARELARVAADPEAEGRLRALALDGLAQADPERALADATRFLPLSLDEHWHLVAASIGALRRVRRKAAIPPLIAFLEGREIGRLREDAHVALMALTHQRHGPYAQPWRKWWAQEGPAFEMPPGEPDWPLGPKVDSATGFYGIHTFSDRMVFVMDLSSSMWRKANEAKGDETRFDVAMRELSGAVGVLTEAERFAVVCFGVRARAWKPKPLAASRTARDAFERWARDRQAMGTTNLFDALDMAFGMARDGEDRPLVDTLFLLSDGDATTGVLTKARALLPELRAWSRVERVRIHAVGIGKHDEALLKGLAAANGGLYVAR